MTEENKVREMIEKTKSEERKTHHRKVRKENQGEREKESSN